MRTPKAPPGFVPVDSEEARKIGDTEIVNVYRLSTLDRTWMTTRWTMRDSSTWHTKYPEEHVHVQLPPPVEWEEVWTLDTKEHPIQPTPIIRKNGKHVCSLSAFNKEERSAIVRALNEMENNNG